MINLFLKYSDRLEEEALKEKVGMVKDDALKPFLEICIKNAEEAEEDARIYRILEELARERLVNDVEKIKLKKGGKNGKRTESS